MIDTTQPIETIEDEHVQIQFNSQAVTLLPEFQLPETATLQERLAMAKLVARFIGKSVPMNTPDLYNSVVQVVGVLMHPARLTDMITGELKDGIRVVWLLQDGTTISGFSPITKQFSEMILLPLFNDGKQGLLKHGPVPVKIGGQKTMKGRQTYSFSIVEPEEKKQ